LLIAGFLPGLIMAVIFAAYIIVRAALQPHLAPSYSLRHVPFRGRVFPMVKYVLPLGVIVFSVIGLMLLGICTPTESAAFGALSTLVCAAFYGSLKWDLIKKSFMGTMKTTGMILMIFTGSTAFSQILSFSGATKGIVNVAVGLPIPPLALLISMQLVVMFLGMFMEQMSILMITLPIFMPICAALHFDPLWFCCMMLVNMSLANLSPPFGIELFVMKAVSPPDITMADIYRSAIPFILMEVATIFLIMVFPPLATWLPSVMKVGG
jgi:tripartite ATP-independent transporter DctM subunit